MKWLALVSTIDFVIADGPLPPHEAMIVGCKTRSPTFALNVAAQLILIQLMSAVLDMVLDIEVPMVLMKQTQPWLCSVTALAMAMDIIPEQLMREMRHDGSEIWWPENPEPTCRRGYHIQELIDVALLHRVALIEIQIQPSGCATPNGRVIDLPVEPEERYMNALAWAPCIIHAMGSERAHWLAWDGHEIYDPTGIKYPLELMHLAIRAVYIVRRMIINQGDFQSNQAKK